MSSVTYQTGPVSPDSLAAALGNDLGLATARSDPSQALPYSMAGASVAITDSEGSTRSAGLLFTSPNQLNFLIPPETKSGSATVVVSRSNGDPVSGTVLIQPDAPGLYSADGTGMGAAASEILHLDTGPALRQVFVFLYGTGFRAAKSVEVTGNGHTLPVLFAGPEGDSPGLDQVNVAIPESLITGEPIQFVLRTDGTISNPVTVSIQ